MTRYLKDKNGRFAGSIGTGKSHIPTAAPTIPARTASIPQVRLKNSQGVVKDISKGDLERAAPFLTGGNCHSVAAALHAATQFPIVGFYRDSAYVWDDDENEEDDHVSHFAVLSPDGYVLDGDGAEKLETVLERCLWEHETFDTVAAMKETIAFEEKHLERTWQPLNTLLVHSFIDPILNAYELRRQHDNEKGTR